MRRVGVTIIKKFFYRLKNSIRLKIFVSSLKFKIICLTVFIILIPLLIFSLYSDNVIKNTLIKQSIANAEQLYNETYTSIVQKFSNIDSAANMISTNIIIDEIINKLVENNNFTILSTQGSYFSDLISSYTNNSQVNDIKIYVANKDIKYLEPFSIYSLYDIKDTKIYDYMLSSYCFNRNFWFSPSLNTSMSNAYSNTISFYRITSNDMRYDKIKFIIRIDLYISNIKSILNKGVLTPGSSIILYDGENIVSKSEGSNISNTEIDSILNDTDILYNTWQKFLINDTYYMVKYSNMLNNNWYLVNIIPYSDITKASNSIKKTMINVVIAIFVIIFSLSLLFIKGTLRKISDLSKATKLIQKGNFQIEFINAGKDELGNLMNSFSLMSSRLSLLLKEKYELGKALKTQELSALQAQINPHFLYNSLNMISCVAIKNSVPEIELIVSSLSKFYKLSLNKGKDLLSIKNEIEHVALYIAIQNLRYNNSIKFELDVDCEVYNYYVLKIILQPIVENSILHGILEKESLEGTIKLYAKLCNKDADKLIIFTIEDDGIGMSNDTILTILNDDKKNTNGYGLKNVNDRIKLFYGPNYGINIESELGAFTRVTISIPCHDNNYKEQT